MKHKLPYLIFLGAIFIACEPSDDRPVVTEGIELTSELNAVCPGGTTVLRLHLADSIVSPGNIQYEINPPIGEINADGVYIAPLNVDSPTEISIIARPNAINGQATTTLLLDNARVEDHITPSTTFNDFIGSTEARFFPLEQGGYILYNSNRSDGQAALIRFDADGEIIWDNRFNGRTIPHIDVKNGIIHAATVHLNSATSLQMIDLNGDTVAEHPLRLEGRISAIAVNSLGENFISYEPSTANPVGITVKVNDTGQEIWAKPLGRVIVSEFDQEDNWTVTLHADLDGNPRAYYVADLTLEMEFNWFTLIEPDVAQFSRVYHRDADGNHLVGFSSRKNNILVSGIKSISPQGDIINEYWYFERGTLTDLQATDNGYFLLTAKIYTPMGGPYHLGAMEIDANGTPLWEWKSAGRFPSAAHSGFKNSKGYFLFGTYSDQPYFIQLNEQGQLPPCVQLAS